MTLGLSVLLIALGIGENDYSQPAASLRHNTRMSSNSGSLVLWRGSIWLRLRSENDRSIRITADSVEERNDTIHDRASRHDQSTKELCLLSDLSLSKDSTVLLSEEVSDDWFSSGSNYLRECEDSSTAILIAMMFNSRHIIAQSRATARLSILVPKLKHDLNSGFSYAVSTYACSSTSIAVWMYRGGRGTLPLWILFPVRSTLSKTERKVFLFFSLWRDVFSSVYFHRKWQKEREKKRMDDAM